MLKKVVFAVTTFSIAFMAACSDDSASGSLAGGTIDPNSIAEVSSSSSVPDELPIEMSSSNDVDTIAVSSSSADEGNLPDIPLEETSSSSIGRSDNQPFVPVRSSSSLNFEPNSSDDSKGSNGIDPQPEPESSASDSDVPLPGYHNLRVHTEDFSLQCKDYSLYNKNDIPVVDPEIEPPSARFYMEGSSEVIQFENVQFDVPCDEEQRALFLNDVNESGAIVGLDGSTLYAAFSRSKGLEYGCSCVADAGFRLSQYYPGLEYAVFDQQEPLQLNELHYTLNEDVQENN